MVFPSSLIQTILAIPPVIFEPTKTILVLDPPPSSVAGGSTVIFTGKLMESATRNPVADKTIKIFESDVGRDDLLASGITESDGNFTIKWTAKKADRLCNTAEIYGKFEGDDVNKHSASSQYVIVLKSGKKTRE